MPDSGDTTQQPPVFGMRLEEILLHVWFDGFTSGATTGCAVFVPPEVADEKADQLTGEAMKSTEMVTAIQGSIRERMQALMQETMANTRPIVGLKPSDLQAAVQRNGQIPG